MVEQLSELANRGFHIVVQLTREGSLWRVICNFLDGTDVKTVLVMAVRSGEDWKSDLTRLVVTTLSRVDSISCLRVVCVDEYEVVGRALARVAVPTVPVVMLVFDLKWVLGVIWRQFAGQFSGLAPHGILDFLNTDLLE